MSKGEFILLFQLIHKWTECRILSWKSYFFFQNCDGIIPCFSGSCREFLWCVIPISLRGILFYSLMILENFLSSTCRKFRMAYFVARFLYFIVQDPLSALYIYRHMSHIYRKYCCIFDNFLSSVFICFILISITIIIKILNSLLNVLHMYYLFFISIHLFVLKSGFQFSSVAQSCLTLCDLIDCCMPGFPVHHQLPELAQTHVDRVADPTISSSVVPFSSCFQSFPVSGSFPMSQFFTSSGQSIGVSASASALSMNIQDWFHLGLTGLISLQSKDSQESSPTPQYKSINSSALSFL